MERPLSNHAILPKNYHSKVFYDDQNGVQFKNFHPEVCFLAPFKLN